jgi:hypothetical protein
VGGGEIFSKLKAGMVYPLVVELKHSWNSPKCHRRILDERLMTTIVPSPKIQA